MAVALIATETAKRKISLTVIFAGPLPPAEETSREGESSRSGTKTASFRGCHDTRGRASRWRSPPMRSPCICRLGEKGGKEKGWQERLSSRTRLVGCTESIEYSRTLETPSCR